MKSAPRKGLLAWAYCGILLRYEFEWGVQAFLSRPTTRVKDFLILNDTLNDNNLYRGAPPAFEGLTAPRRLRGREVGTEVLPNQRSPDVGYNRTRGGGRGQVGAGKTLLSWQPQWPNG